MQTAYPAGSLLDTMPTYPEYAYPPENGFKYEQGYGDSHHYLPEPVGLYPPHPTPRAVQNPPVSLHGPLDGCPNLGEYGPAGGEGHFGVHHGGQCGQMTSPHPCPPGVGGRGGGMCDIGVGPTMCGKQQQQQEVYPWMKESRQNHKRQTVAGKGVWVYLALFIHSFLLYIYNEFLRKKLLVLNSIVVAPLSFTMVIIMYCGTTNEISRKR